MKVLFFGTYDRGQPRNKTLIEGLRRNGVQVEECHVRLWEGTAQKIRAVRGGWRSPGFLFDVVGSYLRLALKYLGAGDHDMILVGHAGHFDVFAAKILATIFRKPLVFDAPISLTEVILEDRGLISEGSWQARAVRWIDRWACRLADLVLVDTNVHLRHFVEDLGVEARKLRRVLLGADAVWETAAGFTLPENPPFRVLYFGGYIPSHGVRYVIEAAKALEACSEVEFELVGRGQTEPEMRALAEEYGLQNVSFHTTWVPPEDLVHDYIAPAHVCLGVFGDSLKAQRALVTKIFVGMALEKPVITGNSPAARECLTDGENALFCDMADGRSLADAILRLKENDELRKRIAAGGARLYRQQHTSAAIGRELRTYLEELS